METSTVADVAALTGKSVQSIRSWCRKNDIERAGKRYLITREVLENICGYYHVDPSQVSAFLESQEKEKETFEKGKESSQDESPLFQQMREQIDFLKEELEKVREEKDKEIERLSQQNENLQNTNAYLIQMNSVTRNLLEEVQKETKESPTYEVPHTEIVVEEVKSQKRSLKQRFRDWLNS